MRVGEEQRQKGCICEQYGYRPGKLRPTKDSHTTMWDTLQNCLAEGRGSWDIYSSTSHLLKGAKSLVLLACPRSSAEQACSQEAI